MKPFFFLFFTLLLVLSMAACKKDQPKPAPIVTVDSSSRIHINTQVPGDSGLNGVQIYYTVTSSENLSKITIDESTYNYNTPDIKPIPVKGTTEILSFDSPKSHKGFYIAPTTDKKLDLIIAIYAYDVTGKVSGVVNTFMGNR